MAFKAWHNKISYVMKKGTYRHVHLIWAYTAILLACMCGWYNKWTVVKPLRYHENQGSLVWSPAPPVIQVGVSAEVPSWYDFIFGGMLLFLTNKQMAVSQLCGPCYKKMAVLIYAPRADISFCITLLTLGLEWFRSLFIIRSLTAVVPSSN